MHAKDPFRPHARAMTDRPCVGARQLVHQCVSVHFREGWAKGQSNGIPVVEICQSLPAQYLIREVSTVNSVRLITSTSYRNPGITRQVRAGGSAPGASADYGEELFEEVG